MRDKEREKSKERACEKKRVRSRAERLLICSEIPSCSTLLLCEMLRAHSFDFILFYQT